MKISPELKKLILWKIELEVPLNHKLSIGNKGTFTKEQLKKHVEDEDEIGKIYIEMNVKFMKALVSGELSRTLAQ